MRHRVLALLLLSLLALRGETKVENPYLGITHIIRTEDSPRKVSMHIVKIDLNASGLTFKLTTPDGDRETRRQTTLEFLKQENAQLAINGHFFLPFPSADRDAFLIGLAASNGTVFSAFEEPQQSYAIVSNAPAINIGENNEALVVHHNPEVEDNLHVIEEVVLWNAISGSAQIITDGVKTIPRYLDAENPEALLTPGGPANYSNRNSWYEVLNARTIIGLSEDNRTLVLFTVDRAAGSLGLTLSEAAQFLLTDYGVYNALNLDGGGSTTLAIEDPDTHVAEIVNTSSDNPLGRSVAGNLAIFASPVQ